MESVSFDGQQQGERVLYEIRPHPMSQKLAVIKLVGIIIIFYWFILLISTVALPGVGFLKIGGFILSLLILITGLWWILESHKKSRTYITDRRIIRFEQATPFVRAKRELFWNETLKAKGFSRGMFNRMFGIGTVEVEPHLSTSENVIITNIGWYEDIANYIDKILFTFKNKPEEIAAIKPFVPLPRGRRDA